MTTGEWFANIFFVKSIKLLLWTIISKKKKTKKYLDNMFSAVFKTEVTGYSIL